MDRNNAEKSNPSSRIVPAEISVSKDPSSPLLLQGMTQNMLLHDRYLLEKKLGSGGMGEIFRALDTHENNKIVAIKRLFASDAVSKKRFMREYDLLRTVQHANLIQVFESFELNEESFMVIEYAEGFTMKAILDEGHKIFSLTEQLVIATKVARAVDKLNSLGIIHRDIKPDNIMINQEAGDVKLIDLGIGKDIFNTDKLTQTGIGIGSAGYMSPEQLEGQAGEKSDIFSLGVTLYQFFTWQKSSPFAGPSYFITAMKIVEENPTPIWNYLVQEGLKVSAAEEKIYKGLSELIQKAMAKKAKDRLSSAASMAERFTDLYQEYLKSQVEAPKGRLATLTINLADLLEAKPTKAEGEKFDPKEMKPPALTGREEIMSQLSEAATGVLKGVPQFILLNGEEGIGKSRLVQELIQKMEKSFLFLHENCPNTDENKAFFRGMHIFWQIYKHFGNLDPREFVPGYYPMLGPDFIQFSLSALTEKTLADIFTDVVETTLENTFACASCYVRTHAKRRPFCIIIDNIHRMDRKSIDWLLHLFNNIKSGEKLLVIGLYRGDQISGENNLQRILPHFRTGKNFQEIKVPPLLSRSIPAFLRSMLGSLQLETTEITPIYKITQGKPYLLIDFVKGLCQDGKITWANGAWTLELGDDILTRPPRALEEQLVKNFANLGKYHKYILQWLALSGFPLNYENLAALTALKESQLPYILGDLVKARYVFEQEIDNAKTYTVSSSKIALGVLQGISHEEQKKFHLQLGRFLEKKTTEQEMLIKAADHYYLSGDLAKALAISIKVARALFEAQDLKRCFGYYQRSLSIARENKDKMLASILIEFASLNYQLGDYKKALGLFDEATLSAMKVGKEDEVRKGKAICLYGLRKYDQSFQELRTLMTTYRQEDPLMFLALTGIELNRYNMKKAQEYLTKASQSLKSTSSPLALPILRKHEGWFYFYEGDWKRSLEAFEEGERLSADLPDKQNAIEILLGKTCLSCGEKGPLVALLNIQPVLTFANDTTDSYLQFMANYYAGSFAVDTGDLEKAKKYFQQIALIPTEKNTRRYVGYSTLGLGFCAYGNREETENAEKLGEQALSIAHECGDQFLSAEGYHLLAKVYRRSKQIQKGLTYLEYSRNMFVALDMKWKVYRLSSTYARLLTLGRKPKEAMQSLTDAGRNAMEIGDKYHLGDNYFERGFLLARNKRYEDSVKWFTRAEELYRELGRASLAEATENKVKCAEMIGKE